MIDWLFNWVLLHCVYIPLNHGSQLSAPQLAISDPPNQLHLPWPPFPAATPSKSISVSIRKDYAKIQRGITLGRHSHLLTPPHHILGHNALCSLSAYQLLQCSVQSIPQSCFTTPVTPSLPGTCGRSPWARDWETWQTAIRCQGSRNATVATGLINLYAVSLAVLSPGMESVDRESVLGSFPGEDETWKEYRECRQTEAGKQEKSGKE